MIAGGESLVSHAGGVLLVETARRSGLAGQLSRLLGRWCDQRCCETCRAETRGDG